jgi:hypothetical protein
MGEQPTLRDRIAHEILAQPKSSVEMPIIRVWITLAGALALLLLFGIAAAVLIKFCTIIF